MSNAYFSDVWKESLPHESGVILMFKIVKGERGWPAMLVVKKSAGVTLRGGYERAIASGQWSTQVKMPITVLKPGVDVQNHSRTKNTLQEEHLVLSGLQIVL